MATKSITSGQKREIHGFMMELVDDVVQAVGLDREGAQNLIGDAGAFKAVLREPLLAAVRTHGNTNQFAGEEVRSNYAYPGEYMCAKPIATQASILRKAFPGLGRMNEELASSPLLAFAEGKFVIPDWHKVAPTYGEAVAIVIAKLAAKRHLHNFRDCQLGPTFLREHSRSIEMWSKVRAQQEGNDLFVIDAQFGLRHRGRSVRRARELFTSNEFGLGAFAVGCMALTHPVRFVRWEQLHVDCAGDEYKAPEYEDRDFVRAPVWCFNDRWLEFAANWFLKPSGRYGSASGFVPE